MTTVITTVDLARIDATRSHLCYHLREHRLLWAASPLDGDVWALIANGSIIRMFGGSGDMRVAHV